LAELKSRNDEKTALSFLKLEGLEKKIQGTRHRQRAVPCAPILKNKKKAEKTYVHWTAVPPFIAVSTGGATTAIRIAMSAPVRAAVAHTLVRARVSAPIIWPAA